MGRMSRIIKDLFVGNKSDSTSQIQMMENKITHVVRIEDDPIGSWKVPMDPMPEYLLISAEDRSEYNIRQHFAPINDFVHQARLNGGVVLIHCAAGVSRSVTVCAAYLMSVTEYGRDDVMRVIKAGRHQVNPNRGFLTQLSEFENEGVKDERKRLREKFSLIPGVGRLEDDHEMKKRLIAIKADEAAANQTPGGA